MCVETLTHGSQHVPEVVLADDAIPVLVDDREGLRRGEKEEEESQESLHPGGGDSSVSSGLEQQLLPHQAESFLTDRSGIPPL